MTKRARIARKSRFCNLGEVHQVWRAVLTETNYEDTTLLMSVASSSSYAAVLAAALRWVCE